MQLIGQKVEHQVFGLGVVTDRKDATLTVQFSEGEKMFLYPDAFSQFLSFENQDMQGQMLGAIERRRQQEHEQEVQAQKQWRKEVTLKNMRISNRAQGAFSLTEEELRTAFSQWQVPTGTYSSGYSKGEPRVPDRMKANSMCILTVRPEGKPESEREIAGFFMVEDTFEGKECGEGVISAHPAYRIQLSSRIPFWRYVTLEESKQKWGNTTLKYLLNATGEAILRSVRREKPELDGFYQYYCKLNHIEPKS